jgi:hypothetical protein
VSARVSVPSSWSICRIVVFRDDPELHRASMGDIVRLASRYLDDRVPPDLAERIIARERKFPLDIAGPDRTVARDAREFAHLGALVGLGAMESQVLSDATHGVVVGTRATPRDWSDAHAGVISFCRGLARELRGLVYDGRSGMFRPFADNDASMSVAHPVPLTELGRTFSLPTGVDRWTFRTQGMRNLGLPELYFERVPAFAVPAATAVLQVAREEVAAVLRRGRGRHRIDEVRVGSHLGTVGVRASRCPISGDPALKLHPYGMPDLALGDALADQRPRARMAEA